MKNSLLKQIFKAALGKCAHAIWEDSLLQETSDPGNHITCWENTWNYIYTTLSLEKSESAYLKQVTDNKNKLSFSQQMQNLVCTVSLVQSNNPSENKVEAPVTFIPAEEQYHLSCIRLQLTVIVSVSCKAY